MRSRTEPLAVFRFVLGVTFWFWATNFLSDDRWRILFVQPAMLFKYAGFEWVALWPGDGMWWHFQIARVAGILLALGLASRLNALVLSGSMAYVILVERQLYNNHDYLLACTALVCSFLPCGQSLSLDSLIATRWRRMRGDDSAADPSMPRWQWWLLRFQLGMPYVFGSIAKLDMDWLMGQPAGMFVASRVNTPVIGGLFQLPYAAQFMAYGGLAFDLLIVPALLWKPTRIAGVVAAAAFHLTNATIFQIGVFPWFMLASLFVFFPDDFIARMLGRKLSSDKKKTEDVRFLSWTKTLGFNLAVLYVIVQLVLPVRPWLLPGNPSWNERGHRFAWRMMLRHKECLLWFKLESDSDYLFAPANLVMTPNQVQRAPRDPELIRQAALKIKEMAASLGQNECRVHALALVCMNGRPPAMIVNPDTDLTAAKRGWFRDDWVLQHPGPLPSTPWQKPLDEWWRKIEMPARFAELGRYAPSEALRLFEQLSKREKEGLQASSVAN